ncbi:MAG: glycoside hydrolase TIM-barrel-like domain-containing protein [Rhizobiaceae bacterium]
MATILLQAAGAFLGGFLGPVGATIGTAAGALAGYVADRALLQSTRHIHGPRLSGPQPLSAEEGSPVPRLYGTARLGATVIWATRFEEYRHTERQGFKGGPKVTTYSYFANVALALCAGEIAAVRRIWADGREIDREQFEIRVYNGGSDQPVDPLIEARQGSGNTPAYRDVAYVVFERFPLDSYGNRIPQFQFEVIRPVGTLRQSIRAVTLIPGATEFGLSPVPVNRVTGFLGGFGAYSNSAIPGSVNIQNRHVLTGPSDLAASLDELQALCPNLEHVALVTAWFGDDLRAGECSIRPMITDASAPSSSQTWTVSGQTEATATEVSRHDGGPAYGGTPSDQTVVAAISELKARGYKVTLYPFVMMDIPDGNGLPDPYGGAEQAAYPWRGRITSDPAPGRTGSADKTALARTQVDEFCGDAAPSGFQQLANTVAYSGLAGEWGYRRMILHYANLAAAAGGVDAFLIGSELCGLTTLRDEKNDFPFVEQLVRLAGEVKAILGQPTIVTYGADWTEYSGHQPADGSGDVYFHLDPLWADPSIGAVGIDNYLPLTDWRDADYGAVHPDGATGPYDLAVMRAAIAGGERYDWYYASDGDREQRLRTPITDGAYSKPWVFRLKDLKGWWENQHFDRPGGVEAAQSTAWSPASKPVWLTELGCPAIDKGPNQPNVFGDPKSSENAAPHFSSGGRSDLAQRRFIEAHLGYWDENQPSFIEANNPVSAVYGGRMVDPSRIYLWAWDARPFPAFPLQTGAWADGDNWRTGHWLNGRLSSVDLGDLINAILADHGLPDADVSAVDGTLSGYVSDDPDSARAALEPLMDLFGLAAREEASGLVLFNQNQPPEAGQFVDDLISDDERGVVERTRFPDHEFPNEVVLHFRDPMQEFQAVSARKTSGEPGTGIRQTSIAFAGLMAAGAGKALAADWLRRKWSERETVGFRLPPSARTIQPGSIVRLPRHTGEGEFLVTAIDDGLTRQVEARRLVRLPPHPDYAALPSSVEAPAEQSVVNPLAVFLDLPMTSTAVQPHDQLRVAAWAEPWLPQIVSVSPEDTGFVTRSTVSLSARIGVLESALAPGPSGRIDHANDLSVKMISGEFASVTRAQMLNGANAIAVQADNGVWEVMQFETAAEISAGSWHLSGLLRGQLGTDDATLAGSSTGAFVVILDESIQPAGLLASETGLSLNWRVFPSGLLVKSETTTSWSGVGGIRSLTPLSPVHLRSTKTPADDIEIGWVRRGRIDADNWLAADIPLGEASESYQLKIFRTGGALVREVSLSTPSWTYTAADIAEDFPEPSEFDLTVSQVSAAVGEGIPAAARLSTT